jgi:hypothetical protein
MAEQVNYGLHIKRFIDKVTALDAKHSKEFNIPMIDAKNLHADITKILLENTALRNKLEQATTEPEVLTISMDGEKF